MDMETFVNGWRVVTVSHDEPYAARLPWVGGPFRVSAENENPNVVKCFTKHYNTEDDARYGHYQFVERALAGEFDK